jgi:flagellar biosynthesis chaperone FliJ
MSDPPYRLQTLLDLRARAVDAAEADLARACAELATAQEVAASRQADLAAHDARITAAREALARAATGRFRPADLAAARGFHDRLTAERATWLTALQTAEAAVDAAEAQRRAAHQALTAAHQAHELVDRHREHAAADARHRAEARAEAEADDRAAVRRPS